MTYRFVENVEAIWRLSPEDRIAHWAKPASWKCKMPNKADLAPGDVGMDNVGNIVRTPLFLDKPCFGEIIVYAQHGDKLKFLDKRTGRVRDTRCGRCTVRDQCERVVTFRFKQNAEIRHYVARFLGAGGAQGLRQPSIAPDAPRAFASLTRALQRHGGFTSVNDQAVLDFYDRYHEDKRSAEAERKRRDRHKKVIAGYLDDAAKRLIWNHRTYRLVVLEDARMQPWFRSTYSPRLTKMPAASAQTTADVWFALQLLLNEKRKVNPSAIASQMMIKWRERYLRHDVLRQRVRSDLARVDELERVPIPTTGAPLWEKFDLITEIRDEERIRTPYNNAGP